MYTVDLSTRECDGWVVVALRGELDVTDAASVATALAEVVARDRELIIDLAGLDFIDSSGLAALARARKHARQAGGDLLLAAPQRQVLRILALTRLAARSAAGRLPRRLPVPPSSPRHDPGRVLPARENHVASPCVRLPFRSPAPEAGPPRPHRPVRDPDVCPSQLRSARVRRTAEVVV
jgi:anti-sigma B factor antagonist